MTYIFISSVWTTIVWTVLIFLFFFPMLVANNLSVDFLIITTRSNEDYRGGEKKPFVHAFSVDINTLQFAHKAPRALWIVAALLEHDGQTLFILRCYDLANASTHWVNSTRKLEGSNLHGVFFFFLIYKIEKFRVQKLDSSRLILLSYEHPENGKLDDAFRITYWRTRTLGFCHISWLPFFTFDPRQLSSLFIFLQFL